MSIINSNSTSSDNSNENQIIDTINSVPLVVNNGFEQIYNLNHTKVVTTEGILSYVCIINPRISMYGSAPMRTLSFLFPKDDKIMLEKYNEAIKAVIMTGISKLTGPGGEIPTADQIKLPLKDGDEHNDPEYANKYYFNCSCRDVPGICDISLKEIDPNELYSGVYARLSVKFYPYNYGIGRRGIAILLNNIQKTRDGTKLLSTKPRAEDEFADGFTVN